MRAHSVPQVWGPNPVKRQNTHLIFSASNSLCGGRLNFFLLANQSFCGGKGARVERAREEGLATSIPLPAGSRSPRYQAHSGLDAVVVDARDHLQGDGVLAGLHVIHLQWGAVRKGPPTQSPHTGRTRRRQAEYGTQADGEDIRRRATPQFSLASFL